MTLTLLAIIPSIVLLVYIYKKDKIEKEPKKLLFKCFLWGIIIIIPVIIIEQILESVLGLFATSGSFFYALCDGFIVAAFSEELFKYLALKLKTWKSPDFDYSFDGIVYAVFVSLGFATFENILYVLEGDISTAFLRMFTAVPGHAYDAVFMGYFYSKAKKAEIDGDILLCKKYKRKALLVPILMHGIYDSLISFDAEVAGDTVVTMGLFLWFLFVIGTFIITVNLVSKASKNDAVLHEGCEVVEEQDS